MSEFVKYSEQQNSTATVQVTSAAFCHHEDGSNLSMPVPSCGVTKAMMFCFLQRLINIQLEFQLQLKMEEGYGLIYFSIAGMCFILCFTLTSEHFSCGFKTWATRRQGRAKQRLLETCQYGMDRERKETWRKCLWKCSDVVFISLPLAVAGLGCVNSSGKGQ